MAVVFGPLVAGSAGPVPHSIGDRYIVMGLLTFSSAYAGSGGEAFDPTSILSQIGVGTIDFVGLPSHVAGYEITYDYTNKKVRFGALNTPGTELAASTYPAGITSADPVRVIVIGK